MNVKCLISNDKSILKIPIKKLVIRRLIWILSLVIYHCSTHFPLPELFNIERDILRADRGPAVFGAETRKNLMQRQAAFFGQSVGEFEAAERFVARDMINTRGIGKRE